MERWKPLHFVDAYGIPRLLTHYADRDKMIVAVKTTVIIARLMEDIPSKPKPPKVDDDE